MGFNRSAAIRVSNYGSLMDGRLLLFRFPIRISRNPRCSVVFLFIIIPFELYSNYILI